MRTYRRLMGFLRPYRLSLWGSLVFAWAAMGMTVLIPWLVGRAINAIQDGNKPDLLPLALAIFGAAILRMGLTVVRRLVAGKVSLAVEFDLRQMFYANLQKLELGFFDSQQTGQLMSRATVDRCSASPAASRWTSMTNDTGISRPSAARSAPSPAADPSRRAAGSHSRSVRSNTQGGESRSRVRVSTSASSGNPSIRRPARLR